LKIGRRKLNGRPHRRRRNTRQGIHCAQP
jgi:hypothetical protein